MKILVVDDNKLELQAVKKTLTNNNIKCEIVLCDSSLKALEIIQSDMVDIVVLDIVMPGLSGIDILKNVRLNRQLDSVQVVMFTSLSDKKVLRECFMHGANDFIIKPMEPIELVSRINAAIKARSYDILLQESLKSIQKNYSQELMLLGRRPQEVLHHLINKEKLAAMGRLAAGVAHEINNPMAYVSSNLETLDKYVCRLKVVLEKYRQLMSMCISNGYNSLKSVELYKEILLLENKMRISNINDDIEELIRDCLEGTDRVTKIVKSLKELVQTGFDEKYVFCDLNELVKEILMDIWQINLNFPEITTELGELPLVHCNRNQIRQVIVNVIINAIQAMQSQNRTDRGHITIKTYPEGNYSVVEIYDDGPGISGEIVNRVFDPFFTTKDVGKGMGMGLSISYNIIVNNHGGELLVASEETRGTVFTVKLPVRSEGSMDNINNA